MLDFICMAPIRAHLQPALSTDHLPMRARTPAFTGESPREARATASYGHLVARSSTDIHIIDGPVLFRAARPSALRDQRDGSGVRRV